MFSIVWGVLLSLIIWPLAEPIARLFNDNPEVVSKIALYLSIIPISFGFQGIYLIINASLNTLNKPLPAFVIATVQMFVFYVGFAYAGAYLNGISGIFVGISVSFVLGAAISILYHR